MSGWLEAMPPGMLLKSDGFASNLYDPDGAFTLEAFCRERGLPYHPTKLPVPLKTFADYGLAFQQRFAPNLEDKTVTALTQRDQGFELRFDDGATLNAKQVIVATGIRNFAHTPAELAGLGDLVTHSSQHGDLAPLAGRKVAVVGAGASAIDIAVLLQDLGASVTVVTRSSAIRFHTPPRDRTFVDTLRRPMTGLGPSWKSFLCVHAPLVFHAMPERFRLDVVRSHLGPAPGWFMREKVEQGGMRCLTDSRITRANVVDGRIQITLARGDATTSELSVDHVIAATGYQVDLARLDFLGQDLRDRIRLTGGSPALTTHFESSVRGLYFVGAAGADSFGPLLRFAYGARFTARRLSQYLKRGRA